MELDYLSTDEIPLGMLGPDNPILHYGEVILFEDELGDRGFSKVSVSFRVMANCFFILLRSYTRIDKVLVRILDTRVFFPLFKEPAATEHMVRDFQHRECTYAALAKKGFSMGSEWGLSPGQSDEVYEYLDIKMKTTDRIVLK